MPMQCASVNPENESLHCQRIAGGHTEHQQSRDGEVVTWEDPALDHLPAHPLFG